MRLSGKKANFRVAARRDSFEKSMRGQGFVNTTKPKGLGREGYKRPGSAKK